MGLMCHPITPHPLDYTPCLEQKPQKNQIVGSWIENLIRLLLEIAIKI